MKLFLTSAGLVPETTPAFLKLLGKKTGETKVCFVNTAVFGEHPTGDAEYAKEDKKRLFELGFKNVTEIDLRKENESSLSNKLKNFDVICVEGGNTFYLLKYIKESRFDKVLKEFLDRGGVYLGISAGSYVAAPDISPANWKHVEDKNIVGLKDLQSLNLVNFYILPHYIPEHEEVINENKHKVFYPIYALTDSQAILINDSEIKFVGSGDFKKFN